MARVVVVGAGLGGLSAAARLAAAGHEVEVCERADTVGGALGRVTPADPAGSPATPGGTGGTGVDLTAVALGPATLTLPSVVRDLFAATGERLEDVLDLDPVDQIRHYRFADGTEVVIPNISRDRIASAWDDALGGGAGADWSSLLERAARMWDSARRPLLEQAPHGRRPSVRPGIELSEVRDLAPWRSLRGLGRTYLRDPRQRLALERYAAALGSDPRRAAAVTAVHAHVEQAFGVWRVRGGMPALADAVAARAVAAGARIRTGSEVTAIEQDPHSAAVTGVRLADGERLAADIVVTGVDATVVYRRLLSGGGAEAVRAQVRRLVPSASAVELVLTLADAPALPAAQSVLFAADPDDEFDRVFGAGPFRLGGPHPAPDPTVLVQAPVGAPPGGGRAVWTVQVTAPRHVPERPAPGESPARLRSSRRGVDWAAPGLATDYADRILAVMAERGFDVRDRVVGRQVLTPADFAARLAVPAGSLYGAGLDTARGAFARPMNRSPVPGLFLVGGSTQPGPGIAFVGMSAAVVAQQIGPA